MEPNVAMQPNVVSSVNANASNSLSPTAHAADGGDKPKANARSFIDTAAQVNPSPITKNIPISSTATGSKSEKGQEKATALTVNKTLRKWQMRAMYGTAERANGGGKMNPKYKTWYISQRDRLRTQVPEPILALVSEEAVNLLQGIKDKYIKVLGPEDEHVASTQERIDELKNNVEISIVSEKVLNSGEYLFRRSATISAPKRINTSKKLNLSTK